MSGRGQVLVLNSGSSSIKYRLFDRDLEALAGGLVERIGERESHAIHHLATPATSSGGAREDPVLEDDPVPDHVAGFGAIVRALERSGLGEELIAIGHRVVHGGAEFTAPTVITDRVRRRIAEMIPLAPLHNPANLTGIDVAAALRPDLPQVAVFDTAFHAGLPPHASRYAVSEDLHTTYGVRRYGFHGTSHAYVAKRAAQHLGRDLSELALVTLHLGNGASATAIDGGRSVETSMGFSPLEGLVMGTRSGDLDPAVVFHLIREAGMSPEEVSTTLERHSGLLGLCGDNNMRVIEARAADGDAAAELALQVYAHRIRKYLGAYVVVLGRLDAVVFTAGVGEHAVGVRRRVCADLEVLGIRLDDARNQDARTADAPDGVVAVHADDSRVGVLVVATDEEREIAEQTLEAIGAD